MLVVARAKIHKPIGHRGILSFFPDSPVGPVYFGVQLKGIISVVISGIATNDIFCLTSIMSRRLVQIKMRRYIHGF